MSQGNFTKYQLEKRIETKFEQVEDGLKYIIQAQCELVSNIENIRYLSFLLTYEDINSPNSPLE